LLLSSALAMDFKSSRALLALFSRRTVGCSAARSQLGTGVLSGDRQLGRRQRHCDVFGVLPIQLGDESAE
jgi:hypothetical protein